MNKMKTKSVSRIEIINGECLEVMSRLETDSVDSVVSSPPYGNQRSYDGTVQFKNDKDWIDFCVPRFVECTRIAKGAVCWVVEGYT